MDTLNLHLDGVLGRKNIEKICEAQKVDPDAQVDKNKRDGGGEIALVENGFGLNARCTVLGIRVLDQFLPRSYTMADYLGNVCLKTPENFT